MGADRIDIECDDVLCYDPGVGSYIVKGLTVYQDSTSLDYHQVPISAQDHADLKNAAGSSAAFAGVADDIITGWSGFSADVKEAIRLGYNQLAT